MHVLYFAFVFIMCVPFKVGHKMISFAVRYEPFPPPLHCSLGISVAMVFVLSNFVVTCIEGERVKKSFSPTVRYRGSFDYS